jgi:hypothetical protein
MLCGSDTFRLLVCNPTCLSVETVAVRFGNRASPDSPEANVRLIPPPDMCRAGLD